MVKILDLVATSVFANSGFERFFFHLLSLFCPRHNKASGAASSTPTFHLCVYVTWFDLENIPRFLLVLRGAATLICVSLVAQRSEVEAEGEQRMGESAQRIVRVKTYRRGEGTVGEDGDMAICFVFCSYILRFRGKRLCCCGARLDERVLGREPCSSAVDNPSVLETPRTTEPLATLLDCTAHTIYKGNALSCLPPVNFRW